MGILEDLELVRPEAKKPVLFRDSWQ